MVCARGLSPLPATSLLDRRERQRPGHDAHSGPRRDAVRDERPAQLEVEGHGRSCAHVGFIVNPHSSSAGSAREQPRRRRRDEGSVDHVVGRRNSGSA